MPQNVDRDAAKASIIAYAKARGAAAVGVADVDVIERIAPAGHGPRALLPKARSVISIGVTGPTQGTWAASAKVMTSIGNSVTRIYRAALGLSFYIEREFGFPSIYCPPHPDPAYGARVPMQSLKLHAEVAGIGARSMAGDILLHPEFGMLYYGSVFTEMDLPADTPMAENPCPAPSCVKMYREVGQTPCQKFCPVACLSGSLDDEGKQQDMVFEMDLCAEMSQQYEIMPNIIADAIAAAEGLARDNVLFEAESQSFFYKSTTGVDVNAQCFECMRVCPIATRAPRCDPIRRAEAERAAAGSVAGTGEA